MLQTIQYRFIRASWGIAINLTGEIVNSTPPTIQAASITPNIWFRCDIPDLAKQEYEFLTLGMQLMVPAIEAAHVLLHPVTVVVHTLDYNPTDYQPEGLACALMSWLGTVFQVTPPEVRIRYNPSVNRYQFTFPPLPSPVTNKPL